MGMLRTDIILKCNGHGGGQKKRWVGNRRRGVALRVGRGRGSGKEGN